MDLDVAKTEEVARVLLCLNDVDSDAVLRQPVFGRSALFHQIKNLQQLRIREIALCVETVAPEILDLVDRFHSEGQEIKLLRNGTDAMQYASRDGQLLLLNAAIWAAPDLMIEILESETSHLFVLPEDPRFGRFERIDLNRRWAGLAIVQGVMIQQLQPLPDGWSIDSYLLRAALQKGVPDKVLNVTNGTDPVVHVRQDQAHKILTEMVRKTRTGDVSANTLIDRLMDAAIQKYSGEVWWRATVEWSWPVLGLATLCVALLGLPITSISLGAVALFARKARVRARTVDYRKSSGDAIDVASFLLLIIALYFTFGLELPGFEAAFLTIMLFGLLTAFGQGRFSVVDQSVMQLLVAMGLLASSIGGVLELGAKLTLILLLGGLLFVISRTRLNAN